MQDNFKLSLALGEFNNKIINLPGWCYNVSWKISKFNLQFILCFKAELFLKRQIFNANKR